MRFCIVVTIEGLGVLGTLMAVLGDGFETLMHAIDGRDGSFCLLSPSAISSSREHNIRTDRRELQLLIKR
jgi:hypothetical protein